MFRRLQWKLTAYYTCFTSLLGMIAVVGFLVVIGALVVSPFTTRLLSNYLLAPLVQEIRPILYADERNERVQATLDTFLTSDGFTVDFGESTGEGTTFPETNVSDNITIFVADAEEIIVASNPPGFADESLREVLNSAELAPLEEAWRVSGLYLNPLLRDANGNETLVVPIRDDDVTQGVIVLQYENPIAVPGVYAGIVSVLIIPLMLPVMILATLVGTLFGLVVARGLAVRLRTLASSAETWASGDFSVTVKDKSRDEIGQLGRQLNIMAGQLDTLMQSRGQLAMIEERNRIARDLHDSAKQQIFATTMQLSTAKVLMDINPEQAKAHITEAEQLAKAVQKELSGLIEELRPAQLEGQGLFAAVRSYSETFSRQNDLTVDVRARGERELPLTVEQPMFRILQESFNNIAKHSEATHVEIDLVATNSLLSLKIHDNGVGFDHSDAHTGGIGLSSMQERIEELNGSLQVKSGPSSGTTVTADAPLSLPESLVANSH